MNGKIRSEMFKLMNYGPEEAIPQHATELAEETAYGLGSLEWLDDADHAVWEIALEFFDDD